MNAEATLGAIIRTCGAELHRQHPLSAHQLSVMRSLADCRTAALGGHRDHCDRCGYEHVFRNSCRDRHCPACGSEARQRWLDARREEVLDVPYFHAVFTIPQQLHVFALVAPELFCAILLRAAGQAVVDVAKTKLQAHFGVLTVLHTWGQTLGFHPHVHCVIPGGGFSVDGRRWVRVRKSSFLFAVKLLSRRFRTLVCNALRQAFGNGSLVLPPTVVADSAALDLLLALSCKTDWHAYVKPPFGGADHVLAYLAAYTHRIAISNRRILAFDGDNVTFSWRDYSDHNRHKEMTLSAVEFLRRFAMHIVPSRFTRVRYFGFLANRVRTANVEKARALIGAPRRARTRSEPHAPLCPRCKQGTMIRGRDVDPLQPRTWFDSS
jgi:uncharacterized protein (DUF983 family)